MEEPETRPQLVGEHITNEMEGVQLPDTESDSAASTADAPTPPPKESADPSAQDSEHTKLDLVEDHTRQMQIAMDALRTGDYYKLAVITSTMADIAVTAPDKPMQSQDSNRSRRQWSATQRRDEMDKLTWRRPDSAPARRPECTNTSNSPIIPTKQPPVRSSAWAENTHTPTPPQTQAPGPRPLSAARRRVEVSTDDKLGNMEHLIQITPKPPLSQHATPESLSVEDVDAPAHQPALTPEQPIEIESHTHGADNPEFAATKQPSTEESIKNSNTVEEVPKPPQSSQAEHTESTGQAPAHQSACIEHPVGLHNAEVHPGEWGAMRAHSREANDSMDALITLQRAASKGPISPSSQQIYPSNEALGSVGKHVEPAERVSSSGSCRKLTHEGSAKLQSKDQKAKIGVVAHMELTSMFAQDKTTRTSLKEIFAVERSSSSGSNPFAPITPDAASNASLFAPKQPTEDDVPPPLARIPSVIRRELDSRIEEVEAHAQQKTEKVKEEMENKVREIESRVRAEMGEEAARLRAELNTQSKLLSERQKELNDSLELAHSQQKELAQRQEEEKVLYQKQFRQVKFATPEDADAPGTNEKGSEDGIHKSIDFSISTSTIAREPKRYERPVDETESLTSLQSLGAQIFSPGNTPPASPSTTERFQGMSTMELLAVKKQDEQAQGDSLLDTIQETKEVSSDAEAEEKDKEKEENSTQGVGEGGEADENAKLLAMVKIDSASSAKAMVKSGFSSSADALVKSDSASPANALVKSDPASSASAARATMLSTTDTSSSSSLQIFGSQSQMKLTSKSAKSLLQAYVKVDPCSFTSTLIACQKTSCIVDRHERDWGDWGVNVDEEHRKEVLARRKLKYCEHAFYCMSLTHPLRRRALFMHEWKWFDRFILITIAMNCGFMACDDPNETNLDAPMAKLISNMGIYFQAIFTFECVIKVISLGFVVGPNTYLRDGWNCLDFFIVLSGLVEYLPSAGSSSSSSVLRTFRLLRPLRALRAVGRFKNLRMLVELLISCVPMLVNVFSLISFIFFVFGILGVQLWQGFLRGRCYNIHNGFINADTSGNVCSEEGGTNLCAADEQCLLLFYNPWFNVITFDGIGGAMIVIFSVMIQEQWSGIMYVVWDAYSFWTWPYFIFLNLVGPMFAIQLFLVVVANKYSDAKQRQIEAENSSVSLFEVKVGIVTANLPRGKSSTSVDPYVKVQVDDKFKKTRVLKNTSIPEWNEYYVFPVSSTSSHAMITMYRWQQTGPHDILGKISVGVGTLDELEEGSDKWYELISADGSSYDGTIHVRTQWRRSDVDEWSPLPEVADEDMPEEEDAEDEEKGFFGTIRYWALLAAKSSFLNSFTILVIILNMVTMAMDHDCDLVTQGYCMDFKSSLELTNIIFTAFFALEMVIKIVGLGIVNYLKETANVFDIVIVLMSLIELPSVISIYLCYTTTPNAQIVCGEASQGGMSVLRSFRLVRVLRIGKLVRAFPQIQRQLKVITRTIGAVSSLVALILLFILIFAILGMSLFGGVAVDDLGASDPDNYPYFRPGVTVRCLEPNISSLVTYRMVAYNASHYNGDGTEESPLVSAPYQVHKWGAGDELRWISTAVDVEPTNWKFFCQEINETTIVGIRPRCSFDTFFFSCLTVFQLLTTSDMGDVMYPALRGTTMIAAFYFVSLVVIGNFMLFNLFVAIIITGFSETKSMIQKEERENQRMIEADKLRKAQSLARGQSLTQRQSLASQKEQMMIWDKAWAWFRVAVLKRDPKEEGLTASDLRDKAEAAKKEKMQSDNGSVIDNMFTAHDTSHLPFMRRIVDNRFFTMFILLCIFISSVSLSAQRPAITDFEKELWRWINLGVNYIFLAECLMKLYAYGFRRYIRSRWNQLDLFLVITSTSDIIIDSLGIEGNALGPLKFLRIFRIFRALRPLRVISRAKGLQIVLGTVARAIVPVMNTVVIALCVFFVFGIMAVQLIGATTYVCTDPFVLTQEECHGVGSYGIAMEWRNRAMQYNWIGRAMLSMFVLASQDNWQCSMYAAMDATGRNTGPYVDSNPALALYFLAFMIVGSFFVIQLFVGVFIDTFQTVTSETKALSRQASVASERSSMTVSGLTEPVGAIRLYMFDIVTMTQFDLTIAFFIVANVLTMACEAYKMGFGQQHFLDKADYVFNFVFGSEVVVKMIGLYPKQYFQSRWNRFDFIVVMISFVGIAFNLQGASVGLNPTILRVLRIFRIFRILRAFRIFKAAEGLQKLVRTLIRSLNSVGNLGALLLLLFFIVGILTVELFGNICSNQPTEFELNPPEGHIDRCFMLNELDRLDFHATFESLGIALLTLFRISTSDNWSQIMIATMTEVVRVQLPPRPNGDMAIENARKYIRLYLNTSNETYVQLFREELPGCQSEDEFSQLSDVIACEFYTDYGTCASTCGNNAASSIIFSFFLCASNFILLNLVMAVLMQELQEAMTMSTKTKSTISVLMSVSAATNKWLKKVGEDEAAEQTFDGGATMDTTLGSTNSPVRANAPESKKTEPSASHKKAEPSGS